MDAKKKAVLLDVAHEIHTAIITDDDAIANAAIGDAIDALMRFAGNASGEVAK